MKRYELSDPKPTYVKKRRSRKIGHLRDALVEQRLGMGSARLRRARTACVPRLGVPSSPASSAGRPGHARSELPDLRRVRNEERPYGVHSCEPERLTDV